MGKLTKYIEAIGKIATSEDVKKFSSEFEDSLLADVKGDSESEWEDVEKLLCVSIRCGSKDVMNTAAEVIQIKNVIKWKSHKQIFPNLIETITEYGKHPVSTSPLYSPNDFCDFMDSLVELMKKNQLLKGNAIPLMKLLIAALSSIDNRLIKLPLSYTEELPWQQKTEFQYVLDVMKLTHKMMTEHPAMEEKCDYSRLITHTWIDIFHCFSHNIRAVKSCSDAAAKVFHLCANGKWFLDDDEEIHTLEYKLMISITEYMYIYHARNGKDFIRPVFIKCLDLWESDVEELRETISSMINSMKGNEAAELGGKKFVEAIIKRYINGEDKICVCNFQEMYPKSKETFHKYLDEISATMDYGDSWTISMVMMFLFTVAQSDAKVMSTTVLKYVVDQLQDDIGRCCQVYEIFKSAAKVQPKNVIAHEEKIIENMFKEPMASAVAAELLSTIVDSETRAVRYIQVMKDLIPKCDYVRQIHHVINMHKIGEKYPKTLKPHEKYLKTLKKDKNLQEHVQQVLNFLAGISLSKVSNAANDVKKDISVVDKKVTKTEEKTKVVHQKVETTQKKLATTKTQASKQNARQNELGEVVKEVKQTVQEIDSKTVSRCPKWSVDVSALLNPASDNNWCVLAKKLGYKDSEVKSWSKENNPCLSMFAAWFAKKRTSKDTETMFKYLVEMKREDACLLVENALKLAAEAVPNEDFEYSSPPPIFISYQWSQQTQAKTLQKHLMKAGYESWLDVGQMGGGQKLLEKIDKGIRGSKMVLSCISQKYSSSPNANREINLAVNIGKPIIPLLMEKIDWPPPGTMGPIFGEYIFIRFYARPNESVAGERYWPLDKFKELLTQINKQVPPNKGSVDKAYAGWWENGESTDKSTPASKTENSNSSASVKSKTTKPITKSESPDSSAASKTAKNTTKTDSPNTSATNKTVKKTDNGSSNTSKTAAPMATRKPAQSKPLPKSATKKKGSTS